MADLPSYAELCERTDGPSGSSWGLWGADDALGCLNLLTAERAVRGAGLVRRGRTFSLNLDLDLPEPPLFGRRAHRHEVTWLAHDVGHDDELIDWNPQRSTQWDGFRHIRSLHHGFYNGVADETHGVHHWSRRGLVGRGVLADVARHRERLGRPLQPGAPDIIEPDDVLECLVAQGVEVEVGDILLVRTGWLDWYRALDAGGRAAVAAGNLSACGLRNGTECAAMLWDLHVAAVAADNPALEVLPTTTGLSAAARQALFSGTADTPVLFLHGNLLALLGIPIGEFFDLDALAADCAADGVYEFLFTSAPLNLAGGVASPPNALAVK